MNICIYIYLSIHFYLVSINMDIVNIKVSLFVSLLTKEEEEKISINEKKSVKKYIPIYHEKAIYTIGSVVAETKVYMCIDIYVYTYIYLYLDVYLYTYIYIYICL
jgi:hypothetical protein